jgi:hypothetical protein
MTVCTNLSGCYPYTDCGSPSAVDYMLLARGSINPLTATDVYIRQIWLFPQCIQNNVFYTYLGVKDMEKLTTPNDVTAVKGLNK